MSGETFLGTNANPAEVGAPPASGLATSPPPSTASGNAASEGGTPPAAPDWLGALPEDVRGYVENKGWKEPGDVLKGYRQLEEFLGADKAGRGLVLPKDEKDQEALDKIYTALGRPEKAEGYELTELLAKEESDPTFVSAMAETMHGVGLSKAQAQKLATAYQAYFKADRQAAVETHQQEVAEAERTLTATEKEHCRRGFRFLGLSNQEAAAIEMYWGVAKAAKMFAKIGQALGEDRRVEGTEAAVFGGSPDAAKSRIAELQADPAFRKRYLDGETEAVRIMDELFKRAATPAGE
jgi:hypothetical protein